MFKCCFFFKGFNFTVYNVCDFTAFILFFFFRNSLPLLIFSNDRPGGGSIGQLDEVSTDMTSPSSSTL